MPVNFSSREAIALKDSSEHGMRVVQVVGEEQVATGNGSILLRCTEPEFLLEVDRSIVFGLGSGSGHSRQHRRECLRQARQVRLQRGRKGVQPVNIAQVVGQVV